MTNFELKYLTSLKVKKYRDVSGEFLIEGAHLIDEILISKYYSKNLLKIIVSEEFDKFVLGKLIEANDIPYEEISRTDFKKISEMENPQGILGLVKKTKFSPEEENNSNGLIIALENINDPGNAGTILRTAYWFGADRVIMSANSVEIFNSKVVRGSQGALFNIIITEGTDIERELGKLNKQGHKIYLTSLDAEKNLEESEFKNEKPVFVFGNEANGITHALLDNPEYNKIKISPYTNCESLNVGVAAGITLYHYRNSSK